ncbi:MAG: hypothetical protein H6680_00845 [Desulfobacteraceae bacterium]|nr:hypothetical protein [Desulfobacteraceae bacterium]
MKKIISDKNIFISLRHTKSKTGKTKYKTLKVKIFFSSSVLTSCLEGSGKPVVKVF